MLLPHHIQSCIQRLEDAGFRTYAVGGCVRDSLLGITPHDYDLCTSARPEQTQAVFADLRQQCDGERMGTVKVFVGEHAVEITTFRAESAYSDNRHPDSVAFVTDIYDDLVRRDFTVNAIAYSPIWGYADPFHGREDLEAKTLRTVGESGKRFQEDSLRILRGMRFAARFRLDIEADTLSAMLDNAALTDNLARERVFEELSKFIVFANTKYLALFAPILGHIIPELGKTIDFDQCSPHHAYDVYTHTSAVVQGVPGDLTLRWAALLHDIGKVPTFRQDETGRGHFKKHAPVGGQMADEVFRRLRAPVKLREEAAWLIANHMTDIEENRIFLRHLLTQHSMDSLQRLIYLQQSDMSSKGMGEDDRREHFETIRYILSKLEAEGYCTGVKDLAIGGQALLDMGCTGKQIGRILDALLELVLNEELPNKPEALLAAVPALALSE